MKQGVSDAIARLCEGWNGDDSWVACDEVPLDGAILNLFAESFAGTPERSGDPFCEWMVKIFPVEKRDQVFWNVFMAFGIDEANRNGGVFVGKKGTTGDKLESGVIHHEYDPKKDQPSKHLLAKFWQTLGHIFLYMKLRWKHGAVEIFESREYGRRFGQIGKEMNERLQQLHQNQGPTEPHWYIKLVGVDPSCQGKGLGREILRKLNDATDANHMPCYLETVGERNVKFYESSGYTVVANSKMTDSTDPTRDPLNAVIMVREPKVAQ